MDYRHKVLATTFGNRYVSQFIGRVDNSSSLPRGGFAGIDADGQRTKIGFPHCTVIASSENVPDCILR